MKIFNKVILLLFTIILTSCSSNSEKSQSSESQEEKTKPALNETFPIGKVIEKVSCNNDPSMSYALYLPKSYDVKKQFPIIYAFDPHGSGKAPLSIYKDIADKYEFIIVGSNNSQNGLTWEQSEAIATTLFSDTKARLAINSERIYLMGFSGGARVANALTIMNSTIAGVICCGAAYPAHEGNQRNNYTFFGIAGNADFNYTELRKYEATELKGIKLEHSIITFDGKHEWPPLSTMEEAFFWLELSSMRKNTSPKNEKLISSNIEEAKKKLTEYLKENQEFKAYELCTKTINYYENLGDLSFFFETYKKLQTSPAVGKQLKENEANWAREENLKADYVKSMGSQNFEWWSKTISGINQKIRSGKNSEEALINKRILGYLSLVCFMQTNALLKQNNYPAAEYAARMYILVDPTNMEAHYLRAEAQAKLGKDKDAIKSLELSVKNGFANKTRILSDSFFVQLKTDPEFQKIVEKTK